MAKRKVVAKKPRARRPKVKDASVVKNGHIYCVNHNENGTPYWGGNKCDNHIPDDGNISRWVCGSCVANVMPAPVPPRSRSIQDPSQPKRRPGRPRKHPVKEVPLDENGNPIKRRRGRPKGSKNKATLEREAAIAAGKIAAPKPKKRGRPKGSKDSKPRKRRGSK